MKRDIKYFKIDVSLQTIKVNPRIQIGINKINVKNKLIN
jgi:hypothetical protein